MDISFTTPALLFPAISLIILAYTNRFLAISTLVRSLHDRHRDTENKQFLAEQIRNLRFRLRLIKQMQFFGVLSFLFSIICMFQIYIKNLYWARVSFSIAILVFMISLILSLIEIQKSTHALELELSDVEEAKNLDLMKIFKKDK